MSQNNRQCTYKGCTKCGVGKVTADATHWLCTEHLAEVKAARDTWQNAKSMPAAQRMFAVTMLAGGVGPVVANTVGAVAAFAESLRVANA